LSDFETASESLDRLLSGKEALAFWRAFETRYSPGHFVLPAGAFVGELIRTHNPTATWVTKDDGGLAMALKLGDAVMTIHPFEKVLKQVTSGERGELSLFLNLAAGKLPWPDQNPKEESANT